MAIFTEAERLAVKSAYVTAVTSGFASVSIAGEVISSHDPKVFADLLDRISADLATAQPHGGMRITQLVPGGCG